MHEHMHMFICPDMHICTNSHIDIFTYGMTHVANCYMASGSIHERGGRGLMTTSRDIATAIYTDRIYPPSYELIRLLYLI